MSVAGDDSLWQSLMNGPYERWSAHNDRIEAACKNDAIDDRTARLKSWDVKDMLIHACETEAERSACVLGKLNQQVENGGFKQWLENGYALASVDWLQELLEAIGPIGPRIWEMCFMILEYGDEETGRTQEYEEDSSWDDLQNLSDTLSTEYYGISAKWQLAVDEYLKCLTSGELTQN